MFDRIIGKVAPGLMILAAIVIVIRYIMYLKTGKQMKIEIPELYREYSNDLFIDIPDINEQKLKLPKKHSVNIDVYKVMIKPTLRIRLWISLKKLLFLL